MCSIIGAALAPKLTAPQKVLAQRIVNTMWQHGTARGRDGRGWVYDSGVGTQWPSARAGDHLRPCTLGPPPVSSGAVLIGNFRAEPTTEYVKSKTALDQQPYVLATGQQSWAVVHNGTIANDKVLRAAVRHTYNSTIDSAAIVETLTLALDATRSPEAAFYNTIDLLEGSFAILAMCNMRRWELFFACNYRPIWALRTDFGVFVASTRDAFGEHTEHVPQMIRPYTKGVITHVEPVIIESVHRAPSPVDAKGSPRALVVCSGGLDSVVAATIAQKRDGFNVTLLHFTYGSRAEPRERAAVDRVAQRLGCELIVQSIDAYRVEDSPLLDVDSPIAGGEPGAEFAHEWVPARNLLMLSLATAIAEARGIQTIILGNNLEEAGAYPDNEPEFIDRFNDLLPFAVRAGARMRVLQPVGNLMKHEIVAAGVRYGAPLDATWSCYRQGILHCGRCGPCFMRRAAFQINGISEVIKYECDDEQKETGGEEGGATSETVSGEEKG